MWEVYGITQLDKNRIEKKREIAKYWPIELGKVYRIKYNRIRNIYP